MNQINLFFQKSVRFIDRINDRITSYRLMLYFLLSLVGWAVIGSFFHKVAFNWHEILISALFLCTVCWVSNELIAKFLRIPANNESSAISGLILTLILSPAQSGHGFAILAIAGLAAMASKFILTIYKSHVFNPAAFGAFIAGELLGRFPSWWVGTKFITPVVIIGGILVLRKMKRYTMTLTFIAVFIIYLILNNRNNLNGNLVTLELLSTQLLFFAVVMLTEPLTSPIRENYYLPYAILVAILYSIPRLKLSPEEALLVGNIFTVLALPNRRYQLAFKRKAQEADEIYSYIFAKPPKLRFAAGQYMEWTLSLPKTDDRGNRRYLTIASAPTDEDIMFTIKQTHPASAFKQRLDQLKPGDPIIAAHLAGEFTLPKDRSAKVAFLAGGVGITPFHSIIKSLIDKNETADTVLVYSVTNQNEIAFANLFERAQKHGVKSHYLVDQHIDSKLIKQMLPDYRQRRIYISGPYGFVKAAEGTLLKLGVSPSKIVTDYFPGYG